MQYCPLSLKGDFLKLMIPHNDNVFSSCGVLLSNPPNSPKSKGNSPPSGLATC